MKLRLHAAEADGVWSDFARSVLAVKLRLHTAEADGVWRSFLEGLFLAVKLKLHAAESDGVTDFARSVSN